MLKNTKVILLLFAVILIWGFITYRVYDRFNVEMSPAMTLPKAIVVLDSAIEYRLVFEYQDPFLPKVDQPFKHKVKSSQSNFKRIELSNSEPIKIIDWNEFYFLGTLSRNDDTFAVLRIGKNEFFGRRGDVIDGFLISELFRDSLKITAFGQTKTFKIHNPNE